MHSLLLPLLFILYLKFSLLSAKPIESTVPIEIRLIDENSTLAIDKLEQSEQTRAAQGAGRLVPSTRVMALRSEDAEVNEKLESSNQPNLGQPWPSSVSYIDDLPLEEIEEEITDHPANDSFVEECLENRDQLAEDTVQRLIRQRRRLAQLIQRVNKQQNMFCRPNHNQERIPYRKCPLWRQEKRIHYYKLMRLTYCSSYNKWPNAPKVKRIFGHQFPHFEKLYVFTQKQ